MAEHSPFPNIDPQRFEDDLDRQIDLAMHDIVLPTGLADRLKRVARRAAQSELEMSTDDRFVDRVVELAGASALSSGTAEAEPVVQVVGGQIASGKVTGDDREIESGSTGAGRRAALVIVFAAAVCGFAWLAQQWRQPAEKSWLIAHSQSILAKWEVDNPANMQSVGMSLAELPESVRAQLARLKLLGTRDLQALDAGLAGQLLRLDAGDGRPIVLLRLPKLPIVRGLNSRFELLPTSSGAWSLAALTVNDETYVLAANCTQPQLFQYIRRAAVT